MAWSAHSDPELVKEITTEDEIVEGQAKHLAQLIKDSNHFVVFTGAGISTSAGIPDFRGPEGVWTLRAQGKAPVGGKSTHKAIPTPSHMSLVALQKQGLLKFVISQNVDGLHRRSGLDPEKMAELHGNTNLEFCKKCRREFLRDYSCRDHSRNVHDHQTKRLCTCGQRLYDSIINFNESLPAKALDDGFNHAKRSDLMLVLGSSLTVTPAADMPRYVGEHGRQLVVCNLQKTPLDSVSGLRIFSKCDQLMERVMYHLEIPIPEWRLTRWVEVEVTRNTDSKSGLLEVRGVEPDGTPATIFEGVQIDIPKIAKDDLSKEPFSMEFNWKSNNEKRDELHINVKLYFMGHYNETAVNLACIFDISKKSIKLVHKLEFDPKSGSWSVSFV